MGAEARLKQLGIELSAAPPAMANYVRAVRVGNLLYLSGKARPRGWMGGCPRASSAPVCRSRKDTSMPAKWASC